MSSTELSLSEQLSALMDGELPEEQARFLRRRLEHDEALRATWSRLQLASSCLKGHAVRPMALDCGAMRGDATTHAPRRRWMGWAAAASVAVLAVALAPRLLPGPSGAGASAPIATTVSPRTLPSLSSADLVAVRATPTAADSSPATTTSVPARTSLVAESAPAQSSPLPLDAASPADFPLVDTGDKAWPRSGLPGVQGDPQLEAYLVRHNQMLANDGLGGFVPYVDVVARDPARSAADAAPVASEPASQ